MKYLRYVFVIFVAIIYSGCAAVPPEQEFVLPNQALSSLNEDFEKNKLVIINDFDIASLLSSSKYSSRISVYINEKGVGQLALREYLILDLEPGKYTVKLIHKDMFDYKSEHKIVVDKKITYLKIYTKLFSNGAEVYDEPKHFDRYKSAYPI